MSIFKMYAVIFPTLIVNHHPYIEYLLLIIGSAKWPCENR